MVLCGVCLFANISCNSTDKKANTTEPKEETNKVALLLRTEYIADSSIRIVYQWDSLHQKKQGKYQEFDASGLISEKYFKQGVLDGVETIYFSGGEKIDGQFNYVDGVHQGAFSFYYERNGQLKQKGTYINNKIEGLLISYYEDGTLKEEVNHVNGLTKGPFKEFNEAGIVVAEGYFTTKGANENLEHGLLKIFDESGSLSKKMACKEGQCCTIWTVEDGNVEPSNKLCKAIVESISKKEAL
jgi:antitoxin component YwqK of YwqJK toxin-antitoxin module